MGDSVDAKQLLSEYSPAVFYVFYASFTNIESTIADRGTWCSFTVTHALCNLTVNKGRNISEQVKDMMETILPSLEVR